MTSHAGASAEALPLPKGGGSTRGLGDGFTPDFNRGTGSYSVEIEVPKGHRDLAPKLALSYNSSAGAGPFGFGWGMPLPVIQIDTDQGIANYLQPEFLMGGESLVSLGGGAFRQQVENSFPRIRRVGEGWEVTDKSGLTTFFGQSDAARVRGTVGGTERVFAWNVEAIRDTSGNEARFRYRRDGGYLYLAAVDYSGFQVALDYEQRPDPIENRRPGFAVVQSLRCSSIEVRHPAGATPVIRRYRLGYVEGQDGPTLLGRVEMQGFKAQPDGSVVTTDAPPAEFTYSKFEPSARSLRRIADDLQIPPGRLGRGGRELVDLNGDGLPDIIELAPSGRPKVWRNMGQAG